MDDWTGNEDGMFRERDRLLASSAKKAPNHGPLKGSAKPPKMYYTAKPNPKGSGFLAFVYHYDESGNKEVTVFLGLNSHDAKEKAMDQAAEWLDENGVDAEADFS